MRYDLWMSICFVCCLACSTPEDQTQTQQLPSASRIEIPEIHVFFPDSSLTREGPLMLRNGEPFSGYLFQTYISGQQKSKHPYFQGRKHGTSLAWYPDGTPEFERKYEHGKKTDVHLGWWPDGQKKFEFHFVKGEHHGAAIEWYASGKLYKEFHYEFGQESGSQKMWEEDGQIRANYVVRNGRQYGLTGAKPCVSVMEE